MASPTDAGLDDATRRFRAALETTTGLLLPGLRSFPNGSCGDASRLLAQYLRDSGFGDWGITTSWRNNYSSSHAWLERGGWIIDITADQFDDMTEPVIVTRESKWHATWHSEPTRWNNVDLSFYGSTLHVDSDYSRLKGAADELRGK